MTTLPDVSHPCLERCARNPRGANKRALRVSDERAQRPDASNTPTPSHSCSAVSMLRVVEFGQ